MDMWILLPCFVVGVSQYGGLAVCVVMQCWCCWLIGSVCGHVDFVAVFCSGGFPIWWVGCMCGDEIVGVVM